MDYQTKPYFSIILPTYNRERFLAKAIQSVLIQEFESWELLVIDDGSKDRTRELLENYLCDPRIKFVPLKHRGVSRARNIGLRQALGNFICFLDSDDYYLPNHLAVLHQYTSTADSSETFFATGGLIENIGILEKHPLYHAKDDLVDYLTRSFVQIDTVCIAKSIIGSDLFPESFRSWEDIHFWLRLVSKTSFRQIPIYTAVVVEHSQRTYHNLLISKVFVDIVSHLNCIKDLFNNHQKNLSTQVLDKEGNIIIFEICRWVNLKLKAGRTNSAFKLLLWSTSEFLRWRRLNIWTRLFVKCSLYLLQPIIFQSPIRKQD